MAKKSGTAPRRVVPDWSWVGTEVKTAQEITPEHRRRAAGLVGGKSCRYQYGDKADGFEVKDSQCSEKRCKGNPRCLNYLGAEEVSK
jgi:ubiquitin carboxyl-terminal hydrolase 48